MARDGLTRREIGWLLAQEARGAAQALRRGIEVKVRESLPPPSLESTDETVPLSGHTPFVPMLDGLAALDDAIGLLGDFQSRPGSKRRGRIDVASLLYELAPTAKITISAEGGGTEVFGEEEELRRMLQLLLVDAASVGARESSQEIRIQRVGDRVHVLTELGPDVAAQSGLERRWLNRMATRLGGQLEVTGATQTLMLPAEGVVQEAELKALRQELAEAQELGEVYARELATVLTSAEAHRSESEAADADHFPELRRAAPALVASADRVRGDSELARSARLLAELPARENAESVPLAETLDTIARALAVPLSVSGDPRFLAGSNTVRGLFTLLLLAARELVPGGARARVNASPGELELSVEFEKATSSAGEPGFPWYAATVWAAHVRGHASLYDIDGVHGQAGARRVLRVTLPEHAKY